jgi:hypothetical protein
MDEMGILLGVSLLALACLCGWLLGRKANAGVRRFRAEHHSSFQGRPDA